MTELGGNMEYIGIGRPEAAKEAHPAVKTVKGALAGWWERVGPGSVEHHLIKAHENILTTLNADQRKEVFAREAENWRKTGKALGIAATVVDTALLGAGAGLAFIGWKNPDVGANLYTSFAGKIIDRLIPLQGNSIAKSALSFMLKPFEATGMRVEDDSWIIDRIALTDQSADKIGKSIGVSPAVVSLGILFGSGPGHWLAHLAVNAQENVGKAKAHALNYVDSGKAGEHAKAVGGALGKGATMAAKYAAEHPEEIRKTVRTVNDISRQRELDREYRAQTQKLEAERQLQREYNMWMESLDGSLRSYYEQNHQWPPPMADFMKEREGFLKGIAQKEAAKKK